MHFYFNSYFWKMFDDNESLMEIEIKEKKIELK